MISINIGCGGSDRYPYVDLGCAVNIDIYSKPNVDIENYICCSAEFLPFRDKSFDKTYAYHVLEHVPKPDKVLKEWKRVTKERLTLKYLWWFSPTNFLDFTHRWIIFYSFFIPIPPFFHSRFYSVNIQRLGMLPVIRGFKHVNSYCKILEHKVALNEAGL